MLSLAQLFADDRTDLPTSLGSADLRELGADVLRQSLFVARLNSAEAVQGLRTGINDLLAGKDNLAEVRYGLKVLGQALGYDPAQGFPGQAGEVPPAEAGSLQDLFSTERLNFILRIQQAMAQGAAKNIWGNEPDALEQFPAWELVRVEAREVPRGEKRTKDGLVPDPENGWAARWEAACDEADDEEAAAIFENTGRMVARKDSDVWQSLGDGAGDYDDTLGNDYEPFAYNSGYGRVEVSAEEFGQMGGDPSPAEPSATGFGSDQVTVGKDRFDPDIFKALKKDLESGAAKFSVKLTAA